MANHEHLAILRQGVEAWNAWRDSNQSSFPDLEGTNLSRASLSHANLMYAKLRKANLSRANLVEANLTSAALESAGMENANLSRACLVESDLRGAYLVEAYLNDADLTGAVLSQADLRYANLSRVRLCYAFLDGANLQRACLTEADLSRAILSRADVSDANLSRANLERAELRDIDFRDSVLENAKISEADLRGAKLQYANLDGAILSGARLWETLRAGWSIKALTCDKAFWDERGEAPTEYAPGEFVKLYSETATIELHYRNRITPFELNTLPLLFHRLATDHPHSSFRLRSVEEAAGGTKVVIAVEQGNVEDLQRDALRLQEFQIKARLSEAHVQQMERVMGNMVSEFFRAIPEIVQAATAKEITFHGPAVCTSKAALGTKSRRARPSTISAPSKK
jgi:uncharacterized protein YjbI with pentapeptide repeats